MILYKLRHFVMFLLQSQNESISGFHEALRSGRTAFIADLDKIEHSEGVKLILRAADRHFYMEMNGYSFGMYMNMLKEDQDSGRGVSLL